MASARNQTSYTPPSALSSHSYSQTIGSGTGRKLVVWWGIEATPTLTALSFDGTSILANVFESREHGSQAGFKAAGYYYDIPDLVNAGTYTVAFTTSSSSQSLCVVSEELVGVATGAPESDSSAENESGSANISTTVTATDGAVLSAMAFSTATAGDFTWSGDVTERLRVQSTANAMELADAVASGAGTKTATAASATRKMIFFASFAAAASAPTITVQPVADTVILSNETSASFSVTATGTGTLLYDWELEDGVGSGVYANLADGSGATWTGQASASCSAALTAKTLTGRRVRCNVTDDNGTTTTNAVALTIWDGPSLTTFPATDGDGVSTATLTCDYVTGVGEAIEVRIPLSDGDVAVTVTTT